MADIGSDLGAVQEWARSWLSPARHGFRVETAPVGGRLLGSNEVPRRAWVDSYAQAWQILKVTGPVLALEHAVALADELAPGVGAWARGEPMAVLRAGDDWAALLRTVNWIDAHATGDRYLREVDVPGVDTKFIEQQRPLLTSLLEAQLAPERIDRSRPRADFAGRFGFRSKPEYVRLRALGGEALGGFAEVTVRLEELAKRPPPQDIVVIVENETTFLALPDIAEAIAICSGGYAVSRLGRLPWLAQRRVLYWGDLDTHGFAMLSQLRASTPHAVSVLMDRATLLAHEGQWVREPKPTHARLPGLTDAEHALYVDLVEDRYGDAVRLEQERVGFGILTTELLKAASART